MFQGSLNDLVLGPPLHVAHSLHPNPRMGARCQLICGHIARVARHAATRSKESHKVLVAGHVENLAIDESEKFRDMGLPRDAGWRSTRAAPSPKGPTACEHMMVRAHVAQKWSRRPHVKGARVTKGALGRGVAHGEGTRVRVGHVRGTSAVPVRCGLGPLRT